MDSKKKQVLTSLAIVDCLFLVYFTVLAYYSRLHFDDIEMLGMVKRMSLGEFVRHMYIYRSGRFFAYGLNWCIYKLGDILGSFGIFPLLTLALGYLMLWFSSRVFIQKENRFFAFLTVVFVYDVFVMTNLDFAQFTWLCAMIGYLTIPSTFLLASLLITKENKWYHWPIIGLLVLNLGTKETFAPILLFGIAVYIINKVRCSGWSIRVAWDDEMVRRMFFLSLAVLLLLLVVVVAPGNYVRMGGEESDAFATNRTALSLCTAFGKCIITFAYLMAFNLPYYLVLFLLLYFGGTIVGKKTYNRRSFVLVTIAFAIYAALSVAPIAFLFGDFGYKRNYTHLVFISILFISSIAYMFGANRRFSKSRLPSALTTVGVAIVSLVVIYHTLSDAATVKHYAEMTDDRMAYLAELQKRGNKETVYIAQLPIPYTTNVKYDIFKLFGREKNPQPVLYYIPDQPNRPEALGHYIRDYYGYDYDIVLDVDHFIDE